MLGRRFKGLLASKNYIVLRQLVITNFKLKYQNSALGYFWSLLRPLFMFGILYLVFGVIFKFGGDIDNYPIYLLTGLMLWSFFAEATSSSAAALVNRRDLVQKVNISKWLIILASNLNALINLLINSVVLLVFAIVLNVDFGFSSLLLIVAFVILFIFSLGISLLLSSLFVKFRDIAFIWDVLLQAGFYGSPILWPLNSIENEALLKAIFINPIAFIVQFAREFFVTTDAITMGEVYDNSWYLIIPFGLIGAFLLIGVTHFNAKSKYFAEKL